MIRTDAWVLRPGPYRTDRKAPAVRASFTREEVALPPPSAGEVLVEPLFGSWEANIDHALARQPIDVCRYRREDAIVIGNCGLVRVLKAGTEAGQYREGDLCLVLPFGKCDRHGYAELVYAYDAPHLTGLLAKRAQLRADMLLPIPVDTEYSPLQWATYARYFSALENWRVAYATWRTQMDDSDPADELVFGWGGGVAFAELQLAQRAGFRTALTASSDERLAMIKSQGVVPVDRRIFAGLCHDTQAGGTVPAAYREAEQRFLAVIDELGGGRGVAIFVDNIGAPLYRATMKALARQGVVTTVGWKLGMRLGNLRASECISRHLFVNTHVWRQRDSAALRDYQQNNGWIPDADALAVYDFDDVPKLADDYAANRISSYFPIFRVNPL